jgi:hypothetical protein
MPCHDMTDLAEVLMLISAKCDHVSERLDAVSNCHVFQLQTDSKPVSIS